MHVDLSILDLAIHPVPYTQSIQPLDQIAAATPYLLCRQSAGLAYSGLQWSATTGPQHHFTEIRKHAAKVPQVVSNAGLAWRNSGYSERSAAGKHGQTCCKAHKLAT